MVHGYLRNITVLPPSLSLSSSPADATLRLRGIARVGDAPNTSRPLRSGRACVVVRGSLLCGVFSTEHSWKLPHGVAARPGVPPFFNGVLGGRCLSKNSGDSGPPKRTLFFFSPAKTGNPSIVYIGQTLITQWKTMAINTFMAQVEDTAQPVRQANSRRKLN